MTVPGTALVAAWDPALARGAAGTLGAVAARLPGWRSRLEAVGRALEGAAGWSGPAASAAAAAVLDLSGVATAVARACEASLDRMQRLIGGAARAQEVAVEALAQADQPQTGAALAEEAMRLAARVAADARAADDALGGLGVVGSFAPVSFSDLAALVALGASSVVPALPAFRRAGAVASWWTALSGPAQRSLIAAEPEAVGGLDGVPAWARDRANRLLLARALARSADPAHGQAVAVASALAAEPDARLYLFSPRSGRAAVAVGDVDTAAAVGVLVPGIFTTVSDDLGRLADDARRVADAARTAAPGLAVATVAWLGYRTPQGPPEIVSRTDARIGGRLLDDGLDGLAAERAAAGTAPARTTVIAHSYGTVVVDEAADRPGRLAADAVALLGSPGMGDDGAAGLEAPEVYQASGGRDVVAWLHWFGQEPWESSYGADPLPTDHREAHQDYYDPAHPTLAALGRVVAGPPRTGEASLGTGADPLRSRG